MRRQRWWCGRPEGQEMAVERGGGGGITRSGWHLRYPFNFPLPNGENGKKWGEMWGNGGKWGKMGGNGGKWGEMGKNRGHSGKMEGN